MDTFIICACYIGASTVVIFIFGSIRDRLEKEIEQLNSDVIRLQDTVDQVLEEQENDPH